MTQQKMGQTIGIKNIKNQQRAILDKISYLACSPNPNAAQIQELSKTIRRIVTAIETICLSKGAAPVNLTSSSRQIYAWLKFLSDESNLKLHLETTYRVSHIAQKYIYQAEEPIDVIVELTNLAGLYKSRQTNNIAHLTVSEGFINADEEVLIALVQAAILGKTHDYNGLIRNFACSEKYSDILLQLDNITEVKAENGQGKYYNLDKLFDKINYEYFAENLTKPRLLWSQIQTYRKFGHYEPARDKIVISLTLDDAQIPQYVVEFVLYHELLHKYHGAKVVNGRRIAHTHCFRQDEKKFKHYVEAYEWLNQLASSCVN